MRLKNGTVSPSMPARAGSDGGEIIVVSYPMSYATQYGSNSFLKIGGKLSVICLILMFDPYRVVKMDFCVLYNNITPLGLFCDIQHQKRVVFQIATMYFNCTAWILII